MNESALRRTHLFGDLRPFAQCHAPTLVARPDGRIRVAFFAGTFESHADVGIWSTTGSIGADDASRFEPPRRIARVGDAPHWNPVLFALDDTGDRLVLHFKVGASIRRWQTFQQSSEDGGELERGATAGAGRSRRTRRGADEAHAPGLGRLARGGIARGAAAMDLVLRPQPGRDRRLAGDPRRADGCTRREGTDPARALGLASRPGARPLPQRRRPHLPQRLRGRRPELVLRRADRPAQQQQRPRRRTPGRRTPRARLQSGRPQSRRAHAALAARLARRGRDLARTDRPRDGARRVLLPGDRPVSGRRRSRLDLESPPHRRRAGSRRGPILRRAARAPRRRSGARRSPGRSTPGECEGAPA